MKEFNFNEKVRPVEEKAIRIKVPAKVAFNLKQMNKVTAIVLEELGCPACHSGFDLRFDIERQFVFNEKLDILRQF